MIKHAALSEWIRWVENELTPPVMVRDELKYTLEAFHEALIMLKEYTDKE